jgi:hypothetical protein
MIAGAVGIAGHLEIPDGTVITGLTMVSRSIARPAYTRARCPSTRRARWRRNAARFRQLDALAKRLARSSDGWGADGEGGERPGRGRGRRRRMTDDSSLDLQRIMVYLPQRYPFLLIDRVLEHTPGGESPASRT